MDALQQHPQPPRFSRPGDPQQMPPPPTLLGPPSSWYSTSQHFQYQPRWDAANPPPYPQPPPYPPHSYTSSPAPPPHMLPHQSTFPNLPHPHQQFYPPPPPPPPPPHQPWGNQNWGHQQGWEYQDITAPKSNEEDWAAKARAWAASKAAMENHHQTMDSAYFAPPVVDKFDEPKHPMYYDHYQQSLRPLSPRPLPVPLENHPVGPSFSSEPPPSYVSDLHFPSHNAGQGGITAGALNANNSVSPLHASVPSVNQQEVPSSYTSIAGNKEAQNKNEPFPLGLSTQSQAGAGQLHPPLPGGNAGGHVSAERPYCELGDVRAESLLDRKSQDELLRQSASSVSAVGSHFTSATSVHMWPPPPPVPRAVFPPIPSVPSGQQYDSSFLSPSTIPAPVFGGLPGPSSLNTGIPPAASANGDPLSLGGVAAALHPPSVFSLDATAGAFGAAERPKKGPVPNWLREEIIKNKKIADSSLHVHQHENRDFAPTGFRAEETNRSARKGDSYSKSVDSPGRSTGDEEDDDEEDEIEAARTVAINQEIKRILTEVLMKVTDEMFDEIATKVLSEDDDLITEEDSQIPLQSHTIAPQSLTGSAQKASARVLIPAPDIKQMKDATEVEAGVSAGNLSSSSPGDVLGLASYASDEDDDDDEFQNSANGLHPAGKEKHNVPTTVTEETNADLRPEKMQESFFTEKVKPLGDRVSGGEVDSSADRGGVSGGHDDDQDNDMKKTDGISLVSTSSTVEPSVNAAVNGNASIKSELFADVGDYVSEGHDNIAEGERNIEEKDTKKERGDTKKEQSDIKKERGIEKEISDQRTLSWKEDKVKRGVSSKEVSLKVERTKDQVLKPGEKIGQLDSRKSIHGGSKDGKEVRGKVVERFASVIEDRSERKKERRKDGNEDRMGRHNSDMDANRSEKRWRSPSPSKNRKSVKDDPVGSTGHDNSSDEYHKRSREMKQHVKRRLSSPSPSSSRRRRLSRSPHSKHSKRRHSPYSSFETRRRRSRSSTPSRHRK